MGGGGTVVPITRTGVRSRGAQAACLLGFRAVADPRFKGRAVADPAQLALRAVLPWVELPCVGRSGRSFLPSGVALWRSFRDSFLRFFHHGAREGRGSSGVPAVVPCLPAVVGIGTARPAVLRSFRRCVLPALPAVLPAVGAGSFGPSVGPACLAWVRRSCGPFWRSVTQIGVVRWIVRVVYRHSPMSFFAVYRKKDTARSGSTP